jgi:hypothetical protein
MSASPLTRLQFRAIILAQELSQGNGIRELHQVGYE